MKLHFVILASVLSGCATKPTPSPTIVDPSAYLAASRCPDGSFGAITPCSDPRPQMASDPMLARRHDLLGPTVGSWLISDGFVSADETHYVTTWSFTPYGVFTAANQDGGEVYTIDSGSTVRIAGTQDGSYPQVQGFYGAGCGGQGWVAFKTDAPTGSWNTSVVNLKDSYIPSPCTNTDQSLTQYRVEQVALPFFVGGAPTPVTLSTVISEHYTGKSVAYSEAMERSFFAKGVGRVIHEAWTTAPITAEEIADVQARCPGTAYSVAPAAGWYLHNCSTATVITTADGSLTGASFGWPPADEVWP